MRGVGKVFSARVVGEESFEVRDDRAGRAVEGVSRRGREERDRARTPRVRRVRFDVESDVRDVP
jgi:hypothetical protein